MLEISCISFDIRTICIFIRYSVFVFVFLCSLFWIKEKKENSQKINDSKILCDYYQKGMFQSAEYNIQIIEVLPENTTATICRKKEIKWILKLWTALIYGLSDKIAEDHQRDNGVPIRIHFHD